MKQLLFIFNPTAGKGQIRGSLAGIVDQFTKLGYLVTIYPTQGKGDAADAAAMLSIRYDRVICAGGDGRPWGISPSAPPTTALTTCVCPQERRPAPRWRPPA